MAERPPVEDDLKILSRSSKEKIYLRINSSTGADVSDDETRSGAASSSGSFKRKLQNEPTDEVTLALDQIMDRAGDPHNSSMDMFLTKPPICKAVEIGQLSAVRSLLDAGFDNTAKDCDGNSPLHLAVCLKLYEIMQLLLDRNSPLDSCNIVGYTPLHMAVINRDIHATHLILETNQTPVLSYISQGVACPPIDLRALFSGDTCLHIATEQNCIEMVNIIIMNGANMNALNFQSQSPLILACRYNYVDIVALLLDKGADSNLKGYFGNERVTPLGLCARLNRIELTRMLVEHGADVNAHDDSGPCPLFISLNHRSDDVTDYFFAECLDKGLDVTVCRRNKETLMHALMLYTGDKRIQYARNLVSNGCSVNQATRSKQCPLHEAIGWRDTKMVSVLLELGADMDMLDRWGQKALHVAVSAGVEDVVRLLLYHGAGINSVTTLGVSPLFMALEYQHKELAEYLICNGSNLQQELYLLAHEVKRPIFVAMENKLTPQYLQTNPSYLNHLRHQAGSPTKLFIRCVSKIRHILKQSNQSLATAYELPLPVVLQQQISFGIHPESI
ncbi:ankyrin-1-like [Patella vulgata]|uniref:ankyrin-1-like n=1 Tax=Patella vulgata TaxID=6465 RepID=UPI0024A8B9D4|nr:ankyrin-1-like [Patella vulgata]